MELPLLQFWIALFTGVIAATFLPPVRRSIPRPVEKALWVGFLFVCVVGVISVTDQNARDLTASVAWGIDQVINTMIGLALGGVMDWLYAHRFETAVWLIIVAGADVFALILMSSMRSAQAWQPRVRLREWMELPPEVAQPATVRVPAADPLVAVNRRLAAATLVVGAALLARTVDMSIWIRNVMLPREARRMARAAQAGKAGSRARLEALREATAHLQFAARAWYDGAGQPALSGLALKAGGAVQAARAAGRGLGTTSLNGEVVDIQALLGAQSIGWYGPLIAGPTESSRGDHDAVEHEPTDRLAS